MHAVTPDLPRTFVQTEESQYLLDMARLEEQWGGPSVLDQVGTVSY